MVKHFGYCPSLRKKVDFEVSEVVDIPTKRGIKYQIKGNYEGRLCNTFCSASKAQELRTQIGSPKVFTVMEAEESQENLAQATQEESVPPIIGPSEKAYGQEGEAAQELPLAQTMPTPIISADDMSVQPIDDLSLPDATLADMQETLDVPPTMDADFEIAEIQPEGDGSSIGNIAPMNPDAPLHAEDFDAEESQENLGQATQEESVPAIIGPSQEAYGQEGEAAQELPLAETVPTPIISAVDMNIVSNDSLSSFNGGDILSQMESNLGERPEIMADFAIRPYQLFGQGRSIGNIAPMNPDVPFASEDDDDEVDMNKIANMQKYFMEKLGLDDDEQLEEYFEKMDNESDDDNFDAESLSQFDIELMAQVPPPVCFAEKIPPSVWENTTIQDQLDYASSKNEGLLDCPQCGISKAELRSQGGYCGTTDPESEEYISSRSCPYEKYFAPQHWIDEPQVISHITPERIVLEDTLMAEMDMPATDPIMAGVETRFIPKGLFYQINSMLPDGVVANQTIDGMGYELSYYGMDTEALDKIIDSQSQGYDIMFGAESKPTLENLKIALKQRNSANCQCDNPNVQSWKVNGKCHVCNEIKKIQAMIDDYDAEDFEVIYRLKAKYSPDESWENVGDFDKREEGVNAFNGFIGSTYDLRLIEIETMYEDDAPMEEADRIVMSHSSYGELGVQTFDAESKKKPSKTAEKAILTGASTGATMEIADALLAAEEDEEEEFMYHVYISDYSNSVGFIDDSNRDFENQSDAKKAAEKVAKNEGKGKWVLVVAEIAEDEYEEIIYEITPDGDVYDAESFEAEGWTEKIGAGRKAYCGTCERLIQQSTRIYVNDSNGDIECADCYEYQQEAETFNAEETIFTQWVMDNYPHSYFSLIRERDRRNKDMDFAQWLMDTYPHIYFSYVEERMARDIGFEAETFGVEFDDWADQEMKSHGENVSFKKWAKEEGEKHGDVPLTDWAEHEEESHDERYGAEDCEHFWEVARDGENYNRCLNCGGTNQGEELLAENYRTDNCIQCGRFNESKCDECDSSLCEDCALTPDEVPVFSDDSAYVSETRNELNRKYEELCKGCVDELTEYYKDDSYDAETFESQSAQTKMKPPIKSIGILLGLGAIAAVVAPENLKKMFKR
jgi:hypothetical protein